MPRLHYINVKAMPISRYKLKFEEKKSRILAKLSQTVELFVAFDEFALIICIRP